MHGRNLVSTGAHAATLAALALVALLGGCRDNATTGPSHLQAKDFAAIVRSISGDQQVGAVGVALAQQLTVRVLDANGLPVVGATVRFGVLAGGGSINPPADTSGSGGLVSTTWTLGMTVGAQKMTASVANVDSVTFTATATATGAGGAGGAGGGAQILAIKRVRTPLLQFDTTGTTIGSSDDYLAGMRDTLIIEVYDATTGVGVAGTTVSWRTQAGDNDGAPVNAVTVTDNFGFAKTLWVLRNANGQAIPPSSIAKRMFATAANIGQVEFQAKVTPGRICSVSQDVGPGSPAIRTSLANTATVLDCNGFPVLGAVVTFSATAGGSASPSPVTTNSAGQAFTTWTLGAGVGVQTLSATASAQADPYTASGDPTFSATSARVVSAVPLPPASVTVTNSPPAHDAVGFGQTIIAQVKDASGNVMVGQNVSFAVTGGGGTVVPSSMTTDGSGNVTVTWTLGAVAGVNTLTITAGAVSALVSITTP